MSLRRATPSMRPRETQPVIGLRLTAPGQEPQTYEAQFTADEAQQLLSELNDDQIKRFLVGGGIVQMIGKAVDTKNKTLEDSFKALRREYVESHNDAIGAFGELRDRYDANFLKLEIAQSELNDQMSQQNKRLQEDNRDNKRLIREAEQRLRKELAPANRQTIEKLHREVKELKTQLAAAESDRAQHQFTVAALRDITEDLRVRLAQLERRVETLFQ